MATIMTQEQRITDIDAKIDYHKQHLDCLAKERETILNPLERARKASMKTAMTA